MTFSPEHDQDDQDDPWLHFDSNKIDPAVLHEFVHGMDPQKLRDFLHWIVRSTELDIAWRQAVQRTPWQLDVRVTGTLRRIMEAMRWCEMYVDVDTPDKDRWFSRDTVLKVLARCCCRMTS